MIKIYKRSEISTEEILERSEQTIDVEGIVTDIIKNVRENGDKALVEYSKKFDGAIDDVLEVTKEEIDEHCLGMPRYKRPHEVIFADIPRNPTGKIEKPKLREMYAGGSVVDAQNHG